MKKSEYSNDGILEEWISSVGKDSAPEGFTHKVMSQVEVEPLTNLRRYTTPISRSFKFGSFAIYAILIIVAFFIPGKEYAIFSSISQFKLPNIKSLNLSIPTINTPEILHSEYFVLTAAILVVLLFLDKYLRKHFRQA